MMRRASFMSGRIRFANASISGTPLSSASRASGAKSSGSTQAGFSAMIGTPALSRASITGGELDATSDTIAMSGRTAASNSSTVV